MIEVVLKLQEEIKTLKQEVEFLRQKNLQQEESYNGLLYAFKEFQRQRFGSKSERFVDDSQGDLFAGERQEIAVAENKEVEITYKRGKKKKLPYPSELPRHEVIIQAKDRMCSCGEEKQLIRYEVTELLNYIPAKFELIIQKREVLGCKCGSGLTMAANPPRILPKVLITSSLLAYLIVSKLQDRQPLYHLEKKLNSRYGIELSRSNQCRWFIDSSKQLQPLINLMKDKIIEYDVAAVDATSLKVLNEVGNTASYWYCFRGGTSEQKAIVYDYNKLEHKIFLQNWFAGFKGYLHADAENIYDDIKEVKLVNCHAHARRYFEVIAKQTKSEGLAKQAMSFYKKLYRIERQTKEMTPEERYAYRLEHEKPLLENHKVWLNANYPTTLPKSPLGKAFAYSIKRWPNFINYLKDGRLEIDNNATEREIKPGVIARKNFLFSKSIAGAKALCVHMSLIRTAIAHRLDPFKYYVAIFEAIPLCKTVEDYEALLPWNINLPKVKNNSQTKKITA